MVSSLWRFPDPVQKDIFGWFSFDKKMRAPSILVSVCILLFGFNARLQAAEKPMIGTPDFKAPSSVQEWGANRLKIRSELLRLLGDLPPRPAVPAVRTVSREDRGDYLMEKFEFDNGAGATVPGYLLLPRKA